MLRHARVHGGDQRDTLESDEGGGGSLNKITPPPTPPTPRARMSMLYRRQILALHLVDDQSSTGRASFGTCHWRKMPFRVKEENEHV